MDEFNKNEKQIFFNKIKGIVHEMTHGGDYCNIVLEVGREKPRFTNFVMKKVQFEEIVNNQIAVGQKVNVNYFLSSNKKNDKWYTSANLLSMEKISLKDN